MSYRYSMIGDHIISYFPSKYPIYLQHTSSQLHVFSFDNLLNPVSAVHIYTCLSDYPPEHGKPDHILIKGWLFPLQQLSTANSSSVWLGPENSLLYLFWNLGLVWSCAKQMQQVCECNSYIMSDKTFHSAQPILWLTFYGFLFYNIA